MPVCRDINELTPPLAAATTCFLNLCKIHDIDVTIIETRRTQEVQDCYYLQGRETLECVNEAREKVGLYLLSEDENKKTVTNTRKSRHFNGEAVDIAPVKNGKIWWNAPQDVWENMGSLAERVGMDWCAGGYGQTWGKGWDNPHFELMGEKNV